MVKTIQDIINEKAKSKMDADILKLLQPFTQSFLMQPYNQYPLRLIEHFQKQVQNATCTPSLHSLLYHAIVEVRLEDYIEKESKNFVEGRKDGT